MCSISQQIRNGLSETHPKCKINNSMIIGYSIPLRFYIVKVAVMTVGSTQRNLVGGGHGGPCLPVSCCRQLVK